MQRDHPLYRKADRADLVAADPHAGMLAPSLRSHAEPRARVDNGGLERANQRHDLAKAFEPPNRINDDLSGAVIRHVAAALDLDEVDAAPRKRVGRKVDVLALRLPSQRDHRRMLHDDPRVGLASLAHAPMQPMLKLPHLAIWPQPKVEQTGRLRQALTGVFGFGLMM